MYIIHQRLLGVKLNFAAEGTENTEGRNDTRAETEDRRQKTEDRLTAEIAETVEEPRGIEIRLRRGCLAGGGAIRRGGLDKGWLKSMNELEWLCRYRLRETFFFHILNGPAFVTGPSFMVLPE